MFDRDFHLLGPERPEVDLLPDEFLLGRGGDPGFNCHADASLKRTFDRGYFASI